MEPEYEDLFDLLHCCAEARQFFQALPDYLKRFLTYRADRIRTLSGLLVYGEHLNSREAYPALTFGPSRVWKAY